MEGRKGRNPSRAGLLTQKGVDEGFQWIKTVGVDFFFFTFLWDEAGSCWR